MSVLWRPKVEMQRWMLWRVRSDDEPLPREEMTDRALAACLWAASWRTISVWAFGTVEPSSVYGSGDEVDSSGGRDVSPRSIGRMGGEADGVCSLNWVALFGGTVFLVDDRAAVADSTASGAFGIYGAASLLEYSRD